MEIQNTYNFLNNIYFVINKQSKKKKLKFLNAVSQKKNKFSKLVLNRFRVKMRRYWKKRKNCSIRKMFYLLNNFKLKKIRKAFEVFYEIKKKILRKQYGYYFLKVRKKLWAKKPKNAKKFRYKKKFTWIVKTWKFKGKKRWKYWVSNIKIRKKILILGRFKKQSKLTFYVKKKKTLLVLLNSRVINSKKKFSSLKISKSNQKRLKKKVIKTSKNFKKLQSLDSFYSFTKFRRKSRNKKIKHKFKSLLLKIKGLSRLRLNRIKKYGIKTKRAVKHSKIIYFLLKKVKRLNKIFEYRFKRVKILYIMIPNALSYNHLKKKHFSIDDYMFLHRYTHEQYLTKFYSNVSLETNYFLKPNNVPNIKKVYTYFFNFRNKKLKTFGNARVVHWGFFLNKTIKKRRYKNFLKYFLKNQDKFIYIMFDYFTFKFKLSYIFWLNFTTYLFYFYKKKLNCKEIYQFPVDLSFWKVLNSYQLKKGQISSQINRWIVKKEKIKKTFWMQQKKNFPKFLKKKTFWNNQIKSNIQYDFITNYFVILKNVNFVSNNQQIIVKNKLLKLNGYRYKA